MKAVAVLLSIYFFALVVVPALPLLPVAKTHSCCTKGHCNMPKGSMDNAGAACCTPFNGCGYCFGLNMPPVGIKVTAPPIDIHIPVATTQGSPVHRFLSDCFHPPEML